MITNEIQNCKSCNLGILEINKIKPFDENRFSRKIVFVSQNPSVNREISSKIFEYQNISDKVMYEFLKFFSLTRDDVYFTNIVKCSSIKNELPSEECLKKCSELFYEEISEIKPYLIITISSLVYQNIDKSRVKVPVIKLEHPSYYFRQTGNIETAARMMYDKLLNTTIDSKLKYGIYMDFVDKEVKFKSEANLTHFIHNINDLDLYNISVDREYNPVMIMMSKNFMFRIQFKYYNYCYVECSENEVEKRTLKDVPCKRLEYTYNKEMPKVVYESDIHQDYRFIIDYFNYYKLISKEKIRYLTFDIETNNCVDVINVKGEILSIVYMLNNEKKFLFLNNGNDNFEFFKTMKDVIIFSKEEDMLKHFIDIVRKSNFVTGFNIYGFDLVYLFNRARRLGIDENEYSPIQRVKNNVKTEEDRMNEMNTDVKGLDCVDTMLYARDKFFVYSLDKPSQYNLDYLGKFLNLGHKVYDNRGPSVLWKEDPMKLYEYNIQDVVLCRQIEDYMGVLDYLLGFKDLMKTFNLKWGLYNSKIIDFLILCNYSNKYVFPSKRQGTIEEEKLIGAIVFEPISDIYKNVAIFDFSGLYPNIIRQFNISYETVTTNPTLFPNSIKINNYYVNQEKKGFLPEAVELVMGMKKELSRKMREENDSKLLIKYNGIKAVINGIYGVFAYRYFRLYDLNVANAITGMGRFLLTNIKKYIDSKVDYNVIAGDSDSVFIHSKKDIDYEKSIQEFKDLSIDVNEEVSNIIKKDFNLDNKYIELECETVFYKLLQTKAKKKYYGLAKYLKNKMYDEFKGYGRGIEMVKKDTPLIVRPVLKELLISIINSVTDDDIKNAIDSSKDKIYSISYRDLLITKQISRELNMYKQQPQHVKAMLYSNKYLETNFSRSNYKGGMLYVKMNNSKLPETEVIMLDENTTLHDSFRVDYEKYFVLFVKSKLVLMLDRFSKFFNKNKILMDWMK